jgi:hypothetical protein
MKRYFVSAMFSNGWGVNAENEDDAIEQFCEEAESLDGEIDGSTIYVVEVEEDK